MDELVIRPGLVIPESELAESASRSGGPGGQSVNTTSSKITLRWRPATSSLPVHLRDRVVESLGKRLNADGELVIHADEHKSQLQNREAARARLVATIRAALVVPKRRVATKPSRASSQRRITAKKERGATKRLRGQADED
jgi:ribosome-associated protein